MNSSNFATEKRRVIIHVDLDAFYAQVEQVRLKIPPDVPVAVQQWAGLIAVNYPARAKGIKRHINIEEARKLCPELVFVHVATFANGDSEPKYHPNPQVKSHKVSLDIYRSASRKVMDIMARFFPKYQRASIDEAYLDATDEVHKRLLARFNVSSEAELEGCIPNVDWEGCGKLVGEDVKRIAHNKTLAKLCSAMNKPNQQTILRESQVLDYMKELPFQKIRNLGGKLGEEIEEKLKVDKAGDLWEYSLNALKAKLGDATGVWVYDVCRGICHEPVQQAALQKSFGCNKALRPAVQNMKEFEKWLNVLVSELFYRLNEEIEINGRWPKTLGFSYRTASGGGQSRSFPMPSRLKVTSVEILTQHIKSFLPEPKILFPCAHMGLGVSGLSKEETTSSYSLQTFFKPIAASGTKAIPTNPEPQDVVVKDGQVWGDEEDGKENGDKENGDKENDDSETVMDGEEETGSSTKACGDEIADVEETQHVEGGGGSKTHDDEIMETATSVSQGQAMDLDASSRRSPNLLAEVTDGEPKVDVESNPNSNNLNEEQKVDQTGFQIACEECGASINADDRDYHLAMKLLKEEFKTGTGGSENRQQGHHIKNAVSGSSNAASSHGVKRKSLSSQGGRGSGSGAGKSCTSGNSKVPKLTSFFAKKEG
ncbi:DNA-directed DNA polymerase eta rad30 [Blyttiomyces sp. JEL0837]|nr:DNA-directed DNA polymerase eta rad30 [Blyttiomyces sp. JEL0837]